MRAGDRAIQISVVNSFCRHSSNAAELVCAERLFHNRQLARTRLDCDLTTPSLG